MPWNNQGGGGGWKSGGGNGGGPWGQGGGSGGQPPDLEDILKRGQDRMKKVMDGGGLPGPLMLLAAMAGCALIAWYAFFFRVNADEYGVVLRFGEYQRDRSAGPGLHYRLPPPIDEVRVLKVTDQRIMDIGTRTTGGSSNRGDSTMMLTGDENIVDVRFAVFWRIKLDQLEKYLFNIASQEATVREVGESVMREVVGQTPLLPLLTEARTDVQKSVQKRMQDILDGYGAGIKIDQVQLKEVDPPQEVIAAFREVQAAAQDKETKIKEAQKYAEQVVKLAGGDADRIKANAQGYRDQTIAEASGQAQRFLKVFDEYKKAPEVTRQRLYLETMERVLGGSEKIVIDSKGGQGVVPYLPLGELTKKKIEGAN